VRLPRIRFAYFVSYNFSSKDGFGFGNAEAQVYKWIKSKKDVAIIEEQLNKNGLTCTILNYTLLRIEIEWKRPLTNNTQAQNT